jgi:transposase InsO family protein/transposase-like protein
MVLGKHPSFILLLNFECKSARELPGWRFKWSLGTVGKSRIFLQDFRVGRLSAVIACGLSTITLRSEAAQLKEALAETLLENRLLKKSSYGAGGRRYMRYSASEKREIIDLVESSSLPVRRTLDQLGIPKSTFYGWYERFREGGDAALVDGQPRSERTWNRIPDTVREAILELALEQPELSARELAVRYTETMSYFVSESSVYRLLKAHDLITSPAIILMKASDRFQHPTTAPNQLWQTDFTYLKVMGWGWFYLSTVLDDYSRYILAWRLCDGMAAKDVGDMLELALEASGPESVNVKHRPPRLLSDNGPSYVSAELSDWLNERGMGHTRGRPYHPMTQGKIERWHRALKNPVLLENRYLPGDLKARVAELVNYCNTERYHESLDNLTPEDVYTGRAQTVLNRSRRTKQKTTNERRRLYCREKAV